MGTPLLSSQGAIVLYSCGSTLIQATRLHSNRKNKTNIFLYKISRDENGSIN
jgi:hypothetical protein